VVSPWSQGRPALLEQRGQIVERIRELRQSLAAGPFPEQPGVAGADLPGVQQPLSAEEIAATPGVSLQLAQRIYAALLEDAFVDIAVEEARLRKRMRLRPVPPPEE